VEEYDLKFPEGKIHYQVIVARLPGAGEAREQASPLLA
jgi:hypothetical protein